MSFPYKVKSEIIQETLEKMPHLNPEQVEVAVKNLIEIMILSMVNDNPIEIRGFGRFVLCWYKARKAHNPKTGEAVFTLDNCRPRFKAGLRLRNRVNDSVKQAEPA